MMDWFNPFGTLFVVLLLLPNIAYAVFPKRQAGEWRHCRLLEVLEQVGRYGCMLLMVVSAGPIPPGAVYLALGGCLLGLYWFGWIVFWKENSLRRALVLSILPTLLFLESGMLTGSWPLVGLALVFGVCHIGISVKNT